MQGSHSPTLELAKTLGLPVHDEPRQGPEPSAVCEICDGAEGSTIRWNGVDGHEECLPGHWRRDRGELLRYMAEVEARPRGDYVPRDRYGRPYDAATGELLEQ